MYLFLHIKDSWIEKNLIIISNVTLLLDNMRIPNITVVMIKILVDNK
jgi:hypothetical protein